MYKKNKNILIHNIKNIDKKIYKTYNQRKNEVRCIYNIKGNNKRNNVYIFMVHIKLCCVLMESSFLQFVFVFFVHEIH